MPILNPGNNGASYVAPGGNTAVSNLPATADTGAGASSANTLRTVEATQLTAFTNKVVDISTSAAIVTASGSRKYLRITNNHAAVTLYIGASGVTSGGTAGAASGAALPAGQSFVVPSDLAALAWHGIAASGTVQVGVIEGT